MASDERCTVSVGRCFSSGDPVDKWAYTRCEWVADSRTVPLTIRNEGARVDYSPTAFGSLVLSERMAVVLDAVAPSDIQRIPAVVEGDPGPWEVLNVLPCVDCIDHQRSQIQYYPADHAEKANEPRGVFRLVIDPAKTQGRQIFRPEGWQVVVIVSAKVKESLEVAGITGIDYWQVT